ncbi:MAG: HAD hydrolase-like protein [Aquificae bacterium]|nr:HAD hydrolase-like protein [Aquificota bacterium]
MGKVLIFDVDGVIVDVSQTYHVAIKKTLEEYLKREVPLGEVKRLKFGFGINNDYYATYAALAHLKYGVPFERVVELSKRCQNAVAECLKEEFNIPLSVEEVTETFIRHFEKLKDRERLLIEPFVFEWLKRKKYRLGVVTGRPEADLLYSFEKFNLLDKFDAIVHDDTIEKLELKKPNPYALKLALEKLGASPADEKYYFGDTVSDKRMAEGYKEAYGDRNLTYAHCSFSPDHRRENLRGDLTFYSPDELKNFLLEL